MQNLTDTEKLKFLRKCFGKRSELDADGRNVAFACPNGKCSSHAKNKLKFVVRVADTMCHCWVCGLKGKTVSYVLKRFKPNMRAEYLEKFEGRSYLHDDFDLPEEPPEEKLELPPDFRLAAEVEQASRALPDEVAVLKYLQARGVTVSDMWRHRIGISTISRWKRQAIFPSFDAEGELEFAVCRKIDDVKYKYTNHGKKPSEIVFDEIFVDLTRPVTIFEGVFDFMRAGINGTCLLGSYVGQNSKLFRSIIAASCDVTLCLDADAADKAIKIAKPMAEYGVNVKIAELPDGTDPGSLPREQLLDCIAAAKPYTWRDGFLDKISRIKTGTLL